MLSDKRIYLRLFRERLALYTCAAPFGTGYFFSFRAIYVPALVRLWHILALFLFFGVFGGLLVKLLGLYICLSWLLSRFLFAVAAVFRNATGAGVGDLDTVLLTWIFHRGIEQRSGEGVRRLDITQPNENATHRFFCDRL